MRFSARSVSESERQIVKHFAPGKRTLPTIHIACGLIAGRDNRILLVRKRGSEFYMQAGGKIEPQETPRIALCRELAEELTVRIQPDELEYLGQCSAQAAHEAGYYVKAEIFYFSLSSGLRPASEIEEMRWIDPFDAPPLSFAPLTRDHILPLARKRLEKAAN